MKLLSIETSCDETALSVIDIDNDLQNFKVLSDLVISQVKTHAEFGGVFPALAKREHAKNLTPLLKQTLRESRMYTEGSTDVNEEIIQGILEREPELAESLVTLLSRIERPDIDGIAVTYGPGLAPALWVGVNFARVLSQVWNVPILPVNHMEGHVSSIIFKDTYKTDHEASLSLSAFHFPMIALLISGGHTQLVLVRAWGDYDIIGETLDDAVGEAFDKVARLLGMEYPGGPKVSQAALEGQDNEEVSLPRPMLHSKDYNFSFSGLKTAVRYLVEELKEKKALNDQFISDIAHEFEEAVNEVLVAKTKQALIEYGAQGLIVAGGVSANKRIREGLTTLIDTEFKGVSLYVPHPSLCGDNSLMIASAAFLAYLREGHNAFMNNPQMLAADSNLRLDKEG